jgi:hypothetical protein
VYNDTAENRETECTKIEQKEEIEEKKIVNKTDRWMLNDFIG